MAEYKDYYAILGVDKKADDAEIRKAYRKLAKQTHPDVNKAADAERRFKDVQEAYEVLSDKEKRQLYDEYGPSWQQGGFAGAGASGFGGFGGFSGTSGGRTYRTSYTAGGEDFSDFFREFFGSDIGSAAHTYANRGFSFSSDDDFMYVRNEPEEAELKLSLEQAWGGGQVQVALAGRKINLKIPPDVHEGQKIRLKGQGSQLPGSSARRDVILTIRLQPHPLYRIEGRDLTASLTLSPWHAVLGTTAAIPLPDGKKIEVKIPPGSVSGSRLRLAGKGLGSGEKKGHLYLQLSIRTPAAASEEERELYRKLASLHNDEPTLQSHL